MLQASDALPGSDQVYADQGEEVFNDVCTMCHSMSPPEEGAPPILTIVRHYEEKHETLDVLKKAMIDWIREPNEDTSSLPESAIEEYGLMPDVELPDSHIVAVVDYILGVYKEKNKETDKQEEDSTGRATIILQSEPITNQPIQWKPTLKFKL